MIRLVLTIALSAAMSYAGTYSADRTTVDGIEVIVLRDAARKVEVRVVPSIGNNAYEMTADELEFANALARHRERSQNRFPTAREILRILRDLGYERREPPGAP